MLPDLGASYTSNLPLTMIFPFGLYLYDELLFLLSPLNFHSFLNIFTDPIANLGCDIQVQNMIEVFTHSKATVRKKCNRTFVHQR